MMNRYIPTDSKPTQEITRIWKEYKLEERTRFNTPVTSVKRVPPSELSNVEESDTDPTKGGHSRWIVNDGSDGIFDAVIVTIGTCGKPKMISVPGMPSANSSSEENSQDSSDFEGGGREKHSAEETFHGRVIHSSQLDDIEPGELEGKTVVVIGSGASGVEAVETALSKGAKNTVMLARDDKVGTPLIPRC
jgi:cation diffusion facilitator CzcD-associated flavoprotein CzcO